MFTTGRQVGGGKSDPGSRKEGRQLGASHDARFVFIAHRRLDTRTRGPVWPISAALM